MISAPKPKVAKKIDSIDDENVRLRNRWSGMIGSGDRRSTRMNATMNTSPPPIQAQTDGSDRKSTRLNSSHRCISYAVFCLKKKKKIDKNRLQNTNNSSHK